MNYAFWFMAAQGVFCFGGAVGFALQKNYTLAWIWLCYSSAQIGWSLQALK